MLLQELHGVVIVNLQLHAKMVQIRTWIWIHMWFIEWCHFQWLWM